MLYVHFLLVIVSIALITKGADWFIDSSVHISGILHVPRFIIGATFIGFFTNLPEFVVAIISALMNHQTVALGNAVGSVAFNTAVVLGAAIWVCPFAVNRRLLTQQGTFSIAAGALLYVLVYTGNLGPIKGFLLCLACAAWAVHCVVKNRGAVSATSDVSGYASTGQEERYAAFAAQSVRFIIGGIMIIAGGHLLLSSAIGIARFFGIPEIVIAATLIAAGTSLPELAASLGAAFKGHSDIALGTVLGSNTLNILGTAGLGALIGGIPVTAQNRILDLPFMLLFTLAILFWGLRAGRFEKKHAVIFLASYAVYTYIILFAYPAFRG